MRRWKEGGSNSISSHALDNIINVNVNTRSAQRAKKATEESGKMVKG